MKHYARIVNGLMVEHIQPLELDGREIPIEERFHPEVVALLTEVDPDNLPPTIPPPAPPAPLIMSVALDRMRMHRAPILDALAGLITDTDDPADIAALRTARQGLKDVPQWLEALPEEQKPTNDDAFDDACVYRYKQLAAELPAHLQSAFKGAV